MPYLVGLLLAALGLQTGRPAAITGRVIRANAAAGAPNQYVSNAQVELRPSGRSAATDGGGNFRFGNVVPGRYTLIATREGFITSDVVIVNVSAGQTLADVRLPMMPAPAIAGRVYDPYGEPLAAALVQAFARTYTPYGPLLKSVKRALTTDLGEYRLFWLNFGEYLVSASYNDRAQQSALQGARLSPNVPKPDEGYATMYYGGTTDRPLAQSVRLAPGSDTGSINVVFFYATSISRPVVPTYFPGVTEPEAAKSLRLQIGRELNGVDFRLRVAAFNLVRGYVVNGSTGRPVAATVVITPAMEDPSLSRYGAQSNLQGGFTVAEGVPPGSYVVSGRATSGLIGSVRLTIRATLAPQPPIDVRLEVNPEVQVTGRAFAEPGAAVEFGRTPIAVTAVDPSFPSPPVATVQRDGQFTIPNVTRGEYLLRLGGLPADAYLKAARAGNTDILEGPLVIGNGPPMPLQILVASDGGSLTARILDGEGKPSAGATVVLVPDPARRHRPDQYRTADADDTGLATIRGIPPGNYSLFAWESAEPNAYLNKDYIAGFERLGLPVRARPGENAPVRVRSIPREP